MEWRFLDLVESFVFVHFCKNKKFGKTVTGDSHKSMVIVFWRKWNVWYAYITVHDLLSMNDLAVYQNREYIFMSLSYVGLNVGYIVYDCNV